MSRIAHADLRDRERERLASLGLAGVRPIATRVRVEAIRAYQSGAPIGHAVFQALEALKPQLVSGMIAGHLQGRLRAKLTSRAAARDRRVLADPFRAAIDFLEARLELTSDQAQQIGRRYAESADTVVRTLGTNLDLKINETLANVVREGLHVQGGVAALRRAFDSVGMGPQEDWQLRTLYRTQVQTAYSAGQWNANQSPEIQDILWGYVYTTVGDDRVRPSHAAMDGTRAAKDDPIWQTWFPPCGYACRCTASEVYKDQPEAVSDIPSGLVSVDGVLVQPGPDEGWAWNPGMLYADTLGLVGLN